VIQGTLTGSSSGHPNDDKWYEMPNDFVPPPIPTKSSSSRSTPLHTNNTFPCSPKRVNEHQVKQCLLIHVEDLKSISNLLSESSSITQPLHSATQQSTVQQQFTNSTHQLSTAVERCVTQQH